MIKRITIVLSAFVLGGTLVCIALAQKNMKAWTDWSKKDAQKILTESPWSQTQVETDTSEMFFTPTTQGRGIAGPDADPSNANRSTEGAKNQATNIKYHIRFFSSRPVRQAFIRMIELDPNKKFDAPTTERLHSWAELPSNDSIIIAVTFDSTDQRYAGKAMQSFNSAVTASIKNSTYLERKDGKRIFLDEYIVPGKDGFGARFIFPRAVDGQPFLTPDAGEVRFYSEIGKTIKLNMRFKVSEMMYDGHLEY